MESSRPRHAPKSVTSPVASASLPGAQSSHETSDKRNKKPGWRSRPTIRPSASPTSRRRPIRTPRASRTTASPSSCTSRRIRTPCSTTSPPRSTTTTPAIRSQETYEGYNALYQAILPDVRPQGEPQVPARLGAVDGRRCRAADAVKAAEELGAFAVWGGPVLTRAWTDELNARGVVCLGCFGVNTPQPDVFAIGASADQSSDQLTEYVSKRLGQQASQVRRRPGAAVARTACSVTCSSRRQAVTSRPNADKLRDKLSAAGREPRPAHSLHARPCSFAGAGGERGLAVQAGRRHVDHLPRGSRSRRQRSRKRRRGRTTSPSGSSARVRSSTRPRSVARTTSSSGRTRSASRR